MRLAMSFNMLAVIGCAALASKLLANHDLPWLWVMSPFILMLFFKINVTISVGKEAGNKDRKNEARQKAN